jgi:nicotinamide riboside transporter PnuC
MIPVPVADWAGSIAAGISIVFLFRKSLWYWYFSIIATALWFYVFVRTDSLNVAGLQVFYTLFAVYGITRWHLQRRQRSVPGWLDHAGAVLALTILAATLSLTTFAGWLTWVELAAVALSIFANWLTALKIVWCWPIWILTNVLFALLFFQLELWGVFSMQFVYALLSLAGWRMWLAEERSFAEASIAPV